MDWLSGLNDALEYMESNLKDEIDFAHAAKLACCSSFHFQRMFSYIAGVPLGEYIRRRRMTSAAFDLQNSADKIIDIALRYGYDSPTAFNRAFQSVHGVTPSAARQEGISLKSYQPISFKITIRGETEMNYKIVTKEAIRVVGRKLSVPYTEDHMEAFTKIPAFWGEVKAHGDIEALCGLMEGEPEGVLGVCAGNGPVDGVFDYYIAVASKAPAPVGFEAYEIPACTWAVFECVGAMPDAIQKMSERIMGEWFPNSGYQYADAADIEVYSDGDQTSDEYVSWIWVPVKKV